MAYDGLPSRSAGVDPRAAGLGAQNRFGGGFREEPELAGGYPPEAGGDLPDPEPDDLDDENRDRLAVHWVWEILLLIGIGALVYLLWRSEPEALRGGELSQLLVLAGGFGLLGMASAVTLRVGAPNLAIGPVAAASGAYFAQRGEDGVVNPTIYALGVAVLVGLAVALVVTVFHVPGWLASLGAGAAAVVWLQLRPPEIVLTGEYDPTGQAAFLFALVAAVSILGGLVGTLPPVRAAIGRFRPTGDPARRRGGMAAVLAGGAIVLSMVYAVIAGVLLVAGAQGPAQGSVGVNWLLWMMVGLGVALVGGTSAFGRRGGVFGTTLAVVALVLFHRYQQAQEWNIALLATAVGAIVLGLVVTRLVETAGRRGDDRVDLDPRGELNGWRSSAGVPRQYQPADGLAGGSEPWSEPTATDAWSSALPARPAGGPDPWQDDRWSYR